MLSDANLEAAGPNCARFHAYVMEHNKDKLAFRAKVDQDYFKCGCGALMLNIAFNVYDLMRFFLPVKKNHLVWLARMKTLEGCGQHEDDPTVLHMSAYLLTLDDLYGKQ
jgi:hypothetical protein